MASGEAETTHVHGEGRCTLQGACSNWLPSAAERKFGLNDGIAQKDSCFEWVGG